MTDVKRAIHELLRNQLDIMHILEEQISILNVSRAKIAKNRMAILHLVKCVNLFDLRLSELKNAIEKRFEKVPICANGSYYQRHQRCNITSKFLFRKSALNMLSLNHLSPSLVAPINLRTLLLNKKTTLPFSLKLPEDPAFNIWYF